MVVKRRRDKGAVASSLVSAEAAVAGQLVPVADAAVETDRYRRRHRRRHRGDGLWFRSWRWRAGASLRPRARQRCNPCTHPFNIRPPPPPPSSPPRPPSPLARNVVRTLRACVRGPCGRLATARSPAAKTPEYIAVNTHTYSGSSTRPRAYIGRQPRRRLRTTTTTTTTRLRHTATGTPHTTRGRKLRRRAAAVIRAHATEFYRRVRTITTAHTVSHGV